MFDEFRYGMNKSEYVNTFRGRLNRHRYRIAFRYSHYFFDSEPKSKKMKLTEKIEFQKSLEQQMKNKKRSFYRGDIAAHIMVCPTERNAPQLPKIAKNYLDLFGKPLEETNSNRKGLIYQDDVQFRYLRMSYLQKIDGDAVPILSNSAERTELIDKMKEEIFEELELPDFALPNNDTKIYASFAPFSAFAEDILFAIEVAREAGDTYENDDFREFPFEKSDAMSDMLKNQKQMLIQQFGEKWYAHALECSKSSTQYDLLNREKFDLNSLYSIITYEGADEHLIGFYKSLAYLHPFLDMHIEDLPTEEGDSEEFEEKIISAVVNFKKKKTWLTPLYHKINLQVLYQPPFSEKGTTIKDLDNMMTLIIKPVNKMLGPLTKLIYEEQSKQFSDNCIDGYEIFRFQPNPEMKSGFIKIGLTTSQMSCWDQITTFIEKGVGRANS